ncbi:P27 family phage terminase small subunit [Cryobacterium sp. PH31-AA6]|uniref:P27 family phage terminase small subunit n=1 Tax=Cryobacterium sp. PH31-AA6 TaxID=3046205 RepID=UPI0024BB6FEA|nr:P27 family phage terminase small subunit [Cryobacterium sp. PH31-AA6]MDJ0325523.1 P27 family phage terminase small subunit [Cryobacterium sp. PH31-AA6]
MTTSTALETGNNTPGLRVPRGLARAGRKLWDAGTDDYDWASHELAMLEEACRTRDRIVQLDKIVEHEGLMLTSSQGSRVHPAIAEARQQRLVMARLLATLGIPPLLEDVGSAPNARALRGVYGGRR